MTLRIAADSGPAPEPTVRDVREVRGAIDAADALDMDCRNGVRSGRYADDLQSYANGVEDALRWVLGEDPAARLDTVLEGDQA